MPSVLSLQWIPGILKGGIVLAHDPLLLPGVSLLDDSFCGNGPESGREGILQPQLTLCATLQPLSRQVSPSLVVVSVTVLGSGQWIAGRLFTASLRDVLGCGQ